MISFRKIVSFLALLIFSVSVYGQNDTAGLYKANGLRTAEEGLAAEEFRRGVQAYYRGSFNDAILEFEKALSYLPEDNLILNWLGKAYYKSGLEGNALESWNHVSERGYGGLLLQNTIDIVRERRVSEENKSNTVKFTEAGNYAGIYNENLIFSQPVSLLCESDGSFWVLAYGSNELLKINLNGKVIKRSKGPVVGFDRPLDIIRLKDGNMLVSEVAGNRLALLNDSGNFQKYIGSKGRGTGQFVGPQYLAQDENENIFVSDYGNKRVVVFDKDGNGLFSFGKKYKDFPGLKGPTGITILNDTVFVADEIAGCIYEFDLAGNYKNNLLEKGTLKKPESLKLWNDYLILCDSNKVYTIDSNTGVMFENIKTGNAPSKVTCAVPDVNGNIIVSDFVTNEIYVMSRVQEVIGGLFVQIDKINADKFPQVFVDLKIENHNRKAVVGLSERNFYFTENKNPVADLKLIGASSNLDYCDVTLIIDRSNEMKAYGDQIDNAVREIAASMKDKGTLRIMSCGSIPVTEYTGTPAGASLFSVKGLKSPHSQNVSLDLALRLAGNDLINAAKKRAVIYISNGKVSNSAFKKYSLNEISSYFNNNCIEFMFVQLKQGGIDETIEYLCRSTGGKEYYIYRPEGLNQIISDIIKVPNGIYSFCYTSMLPTNFGEKFLSLETEVYLMNRSGRDELGYFAPLE